LEEEHMEQPRQQPEYATERFSQFALRLGDLSLLPEHSSLVVDLLTGTIALVNWQEAQFLDVIEVGDDEQFALMFTLLKQWPSYVPYERLIGHLGISLTNQEIEDLERVRTSGWANEPEGEQAQDQLADARLRPVLQTLRDLLQDCRPALQGFGIDIVAVKDYGPLLVPFKEVRTASVPEAIR
jgi:hypothetical protein